MFGQACSRIDNKKKDLLGIIEEISDVNHDGYTSYSEWKSTYELDLGIPYSGQRGKDLTKEQLRALASMYGK